MGKKIHSDESTAEFRTTLGARIRAARKAKGLTQNQAAEEIGISAEFFARIERGNGLPSVATLREISRALNVSVDLLFATESMIPSILTPEDSEPGPRLSRQMARIVELAREDEDLRRLLVALMKMAARRLNEAPDED